jgi:EmrB/QacA subfamily drug resistance transporter
MSNIQENRGLKGNWPALIGVAMTAFLASLDFAIVNTALPNIQQTFHASVTELQWVMNAFVIVQAIFLVTMGKLGDIVGHKKLLYIGVLAFTLASIICGVSWSVGGLILGRAIQGAAVAILIPCSLAMTSSMVSEANRGKAIGLWSAVSGVAFAIGPVVGGFIVSMSSWPFIFFVNVPVAIVALVLMKVFVKNEPSKLAHKLYASNIILLAIFIFSVIFFLIEAPQLHWDLSFVISFVVLILLSGYFYFKCEKKREQPIIDQGLFKNNLFLAGAISNFSMVAFAFSSFFLIPLFLAHIRHEAIYEIGLMLLPITAAMVVLSPIVGLVVDKYGFRIPLVFGLICLVVSAALQALTGGAAHVYGLIAGFVFMGVGWGSIFGASATAAVASLPQDRAGTATGTLWTIQNIGGALGLTVITLIYELLTLHGYGMAVVFSVSMWVLLGGSALACLAVTLLLNKKISPKLPSEHG